MTTDTRPDFGAASVSAKGAPSELSVPASVAHTHEPWHVTVTWAGEVKVHGDPDGDMDADSGRTIDCTDYVAVMEDTPRAEANAARIVACVNACEGLSDDDLLLGSPLVNIVRQGGFQLAQIQELKAQLTDADLRITEALAERDEIAEAGSAWMMREEAARAQRDELAAALRAIVNSPNAAEHIVSRLLRPARAALEKVK